MKDHHYKYIVFGTLIILNVVIVCYGVRPFLDSIATKINGGVSASEIRFMAYCNEGDNMTTDQDCHGGTENAR